MIIDTSRLKNGLKDTVLTQSAIFFRPDTLKVTGSTISNPQKLRRASPSGQVHAFFYIIISTILYEQRGSNLPKKLRTS